MLSTKARALEKGTRNTCNILNFVGAGMLLVLMLQGAADVIGRYLFNSPIIGTLERGELLLACMVFLSLGTTQIKKQQINVEFFTSRFSPQAQAITKFVIILVTLVLVGLIVWRGMLAAIATYESGRLVYVINWPLAPFQFVIPFGALVLCFVLIMELVQYYRHMRVKD